MKCRGQNGVKTGNGGLAKWETSRHMQAAAYLYKGTTYEKLCVFRKWNEKMN